MGVDGTSYFDYPTLSSMDGVPSRWWGFRSGSQDTGLAKVPRVAEAGANSGGAILSSDIVVSSTKDRSLNHGTKNEAGPRTRNGRNGKA